MVWPRSQECHRNACCIRLWGGQKEHEGRTVEPELGETGLIPGRNWEYSKRSKEITEDGRSLRYTSAGAMKTSK